MPYTPITPPTQKIGQAGGFGGTQSFLGRQNLPGQTAGVAGPQQSLAGYGAPSPTPMFQNSVGPDPTYNPGLPSGWGGGTANVSQTGQNQSVQNGVLSVNHGGNPITSPHLFDRQTLAALNDGSLMFGGTQGPVSLKGMLGDMGGRAGGGAELPLNNYLSAISQDGPQLRSLAQLPNAATNADSLRLLSEAQMPTNYQSTDTGGNGWSPNDQGLNSGATNQANWAWAQSINPGLRQPTSVAGLPAGDSQGAYAVGGQYGAPVAGSAAQGQFPQYGSGTYTGGGGGGGAMPYSPAFDVQTSLDRINAPGAFDGKTQRDFNNRTAVNQLMPTIQGAIPTLPMGFGPGNFQDRFTDPLALLSGPLFDEGATGLRDERGGAALGSSLNLLLSQMLAGGQRGQERDQLFANNQQNAQMSSQNTANEFAARAAMDMVNPGQLDARYGDLERAAREANAAGLNSTRNRMSDLGLASGGMGQAPALLAAEQGSNRDLQGTLLQLAQMKADEQRQNLSTAQNALGTGTDIFRALNMDPNTAMAMNLATPQNTQVGPMADALERAAQISAGQALANKGADPLALLSGLAGGLVGGIGQARGIKNFLGLG